MKKSITLLIIILLIVSASAENPVIEQSEDGWLTVEMDKIQQVDEPPLITDEVPFNATPDWCMHLRMQVGGMKLADLDNDMDLDLAVGCYYSQSYPPYDDYHNFILYNIDGVLQSSPGWWSSDESHTTEISIADFNGDGYNDIFSANGGFSFQASRIYFYSESNDSVQRTSSWSSSDNCFTTGSDVCDFDNDGDIDIATSNQGVSPAPYRPVHIFVNNDGVIENSPSWSSAAQEISGYVAWGDYNLDGWPDLAVSKWVNFYSCVYTNNEGTVQTTPGWTSNNDDSQKGIGWGDTDGDSYPEVAIGGSGLATQLYDNSEGVLGTTPIWESVNSYHGCQDLRWGDIDNDGDDDLATVLFSNGQVRIYLNVDGELESSPSWIYDSPEAGTAVEFGDINGDGRLDLVAGFSGDTCVAVFYNTGTTSIEERNELPKQTALIGNYPNPFNAETLIEFNIENTSDISLRVYDIKGRLVRTLMQGDCEAGRHSVVWDGCDFSGDIVSTGVYFYRLATDNTVETRKMLMMK